MSARSRIVTLAGTAIAIVVVLWLGVEYFSCKQRGAAFTRQVGVIRHDAENQLKVGATTADIARFFEDHQIRLVVEGLQAHGALRASGCAVGCGAPAIIQVRVELDSQGAVAKAAVVQGLYTDCM